MIYDRDYIMERVAIAPSGCWEWQKCASKGYGTVSPIGAIDTSAHRLAYRIFKGPPEGLVIMHTCDNPSCVNPEHLVAGTYLDNLNDARRKERWYPTQAWKVTPVVKVSVETHLLETNLSQRQIAKLHNIVPSSVNRIKHRMTSHG